MKLAEREAYRGSHLQMSFMTSEDVTLKFYSPKFSNLAFTTDSLAGSVLIYCNLME